MTKSLKELSNNGRKTCYITRKNKQNSRKKHMDTAIRPRTYIDKKQTNTSEQRKLKTFDLFVEERDLYPPISSSICSHWLKF